MDAGRLVRAVMDGVQAAARARFENPRARFGDAHADTALVAVELGISLTDSGEWAEAAMLLDRSLPVLLRVIGDTHPARLSVTQGLVRRVAPSPRSRSDGLKRPSGCDASRTTATCSLLRLHTVGEVAQLLRFYEAVLIAPRMQRPYGPYVTAH
ncbi:tetratricopeptide repeat protein [Actinoplanes sp. TBRC 11911]|uniref:tetratricopeptide repeat protein n=1 Tax=Actinoplanes sp. TBRC 11911 TaxID=2729386 RepID=UPI00145C992C|nr:tetratricopeptide repeat protein [Actinoplanes sp. TBRC 11911]NMO57530.1 tetratricopeptide repeat protein [Actinoplanes sp. TBRC 11911]